MTAGFQPPCPGPSDSSCVFWHDFEELTPTNLWKDQSRNGLHATPQAGFVAPSYGIGISAKGKKYVDFTGAANRYGTLPLRFYDVAPTGAHTWVMVAKHTTPVANARIFSCRNVGATRGISLQVYSVAADAVQHTMNVYDTAGVLSQMFDAVAINTTSRTRVSIYSFDKPRCSAGTGPAFGGCVWHDTVQANGTVSAGSTVTAIGYDTATVPAIGAFSGGGNYWIGNLFFLALYNGLWVPSDREAKALSTWLRDVC